MADSSFTLDIFRGTPEGALAVETSTHTLGHGEIYIETTHSGLCGTDLHYLARGGIIGHEGVGVVRQLGPGVTDVKVGDRVGFGYTHKVCGTCDCCLSGELSINIIIISEWMNYGYSHFRMNNTSTSSQNTWLTISQEETNTAPTA